MNRHQRRLEASKNRLILKHERTRGETMKLSIRDRLYLQQVLPVQGTFVSLRIRNSLLEKIGFSEEDYAKYELTEVGSTCNWWGTAEAKKIKQKVIAENRNFTMDELERFDAIDEVEVSIGPKGMAMIVDELKRLDAEGKLPGIWMPMAEKFLGAKEDDEDLPVTEPTNGSTVPEHAKSS
jgi:hypothetical protein